MQLVKEITLSAERIRELFSYDPETGVLIWRKPVRCNFIGRKAGSVTREGYRIVYVDKRWILAHRIAWIYVYGRWPTAWIDHIDGDPLNNRIANLREAEPWQNSANRKNLKGATLHRGRWQAQIRFKGKNFYLGCFETEELARAAYVAKARELKGEFASV